MSSNVFTVPHMSVNGWKLNEHPGLVVPQKKTADQLAAIEHLERGANH
jgi:hypothetical protein